MKKIKLLFFFVSLEIFSAILLKEESNSINDDTLKCLYGASTECNSIKLASNNYQCCTQNIKSYLDNQNPLEYQICDLTINPIKAGEEEMETEKGKISKEYFGYNSYYSQYESFIIRQEIEINCEDGNLNLLMRKSDYTDEEKNKFKSKSHCLRFLFGVTEEEANKETCFDSILSTVSQDSGVSCGFYEITLNFNDGTNTNFNSCCIFNDDIIENKNIGYWTKWMMYRLTLNKSNKMGKQLSNFKMAFTNSKGKTLLYDSSTDIVTDSDSKSVSSYLGACRYIFFLIFLLI